MHFRSELVTTGRMGRAAFWTRHLTLIPLALWLVIASGETPGRPADIPFVVLLLAILTSTWGRRLHDRGHSAWWLFAVLVPVIGVVWLAVECGLRDSAIRGDRFGPKPGLRPDYLRVCSIVEPPLQP